MDFVLIWLAVIHIAKAVLLGSTHLQSLQTTLQMLITHVMR